MSTKHTPGPMPSDRFGAALAAKVFASRKGHGGAPASEIHLKQADLAVLLSAAYELGIEAATQVLSSAPQEPTMSEAKPRALEVADALDETSVTFDHELATVEQAAALLRQQHAAIVELRDALGRCKFDSLNMALDDLAFVRATLTNTEGLSK